MTMTIAEIEEYFNSFPPGYKFDPSDEELIIEYLLPKMKGGKMHVNLMHDVNIYQHNPDYLAEKYSPQGNKGWYFFTPRDKKYPNGSRPNRQAVAGYWKATGADKAIRRDDIEIGSRRALVFYQGKPPKGEKTLWIMHEFRVAGPSQVKKRKHSSINDGNTNSMRLDDYILCRIYKKNVLSPKHKFQAENERFESKVDEMRDGENCSKESSLIDDINRGGNMYNTSNHPCDDNVDVYQYTRVDDNTYGASNNHGNHNVNVYTTSYNDGDDPSSVQPLNVNPSTSYAAELLDWDPYQTYGHYNFSEDLNNVDYNNDYEPSLLHFLLDYPQNPTMADLDTNPMGMISSRHEDINMLNPPPHLTEEIQVKDVSQLPPPPPPPHTPLCSLPC